MIDNQKLHAAAASLQAHLFGKPSLHSEGFIGLGLNNIQVYVRAPKKRWRGDTPGEWEGCPVVWRFGIGIARAQLNDGGGDAGR